MSHAHEVTEIGVRLSIPTDALHVGSAMITEIVSTMPHAPFRIAGYSVDGTRTNLILAVNMGTSEEIRDRGIRSRAAVELIQRLVIDLSQFDAAFDAIPAEGSAAANAAAQHSTIGTILPVHAVEPAL